MGMGIHLVTKPKVAKSNSTPTSLVSTKEKATSNQLSTPLNYLKYLVSNAAKYELKNTREFEIAKNLLSDMNVVISLGQSADVNGLNNLLSKYASVNVDLIRLSIMIDGKRDTELIQAMEKAKAPAKHISSAKLYLQEKRLIQAELIAAQKSGDRVKIESIDSRLQTLGDRPDFLQTYSR